MYSLSLGPLALPVAPLFLIGSVWLGAWAAGRWAGRHPDPGQGIPPGERPGDELIHAMWWGLLWARLVHVGLNADLYLAQPLAMLDVRDGGWHAWSGWAAGLAWLCEPASPTGRNEPALAQLDAGHAWRVLDAAYEPLRLSGAPSLAAAQCSRLWQLCTPNKALGLTGVRAAYALAPVGAADEVQALEAAAPSWVLGAEGVALLTAWTTPAVQRWLADSLPTLREWKRLQLDWLQARGWQHLPGDTPFLCVQPPGPLDLPALRRHGIGLRDAASLGLPGWYRMAVLAPPALQALDRALAPPAGHAVRGACA